MNDVFVHPTALVAADEIGGGTRIWAFSNVLEGARVGENCNIGDHCFVEGGAVLGDGVTLKNGTCVWDGVTLEEGVFVGPGVRFTNDLRPRSPRLTESAGRYDDLGWLSPTLVRRGASLGAGAVILCGLEIGEFAFVAAGAVVTRDVAPFSLVVGTPARPRAWVCRCGARLRFVSESAECAECGAAYELGESGVVPHLDLSVRGTARRSR